MKLVDPRTPGGAPTNYKSVISNGLNKVYADNTASGTATTQTSGEREGDYLHGILFMAGMTWEMTQGVIIRDTTNWGGVVEQTLAIKPNVNAGVAAGAAAVNAATDNGWAIPPGMFVPIGLTAVNGWAITMGSGGTIAMVTNGVLLIGLFRE